MVTLRNALKLRRCKPWLFVICWLLTLVTVGQAQTGNPEHPVYNFNVELTVLDETTASDLFGENINREFYVTRARLRGSQRDRVALSPGKAGVDYQTIFAFIIRAGTVRLEERSGATWQELTPTTLNGLRRQELQPPFKLFPVYAVDENSYDVLKEFCKGSSNCQSPTTLPTAPYRPSTLKKFVRWIFRKGSNRRELTRVLKSVEHLPIKTDALRILLIPKRPFPYRDIRIKQILTGNTEVVIQP